MQIKPRTIKSENGFTMVELIIVVLIIGILSAIAVGTLSASRLYNADNQALVLLDFIKEARQRSLTQQRIMRVEINSTRRMIRLINEHTAGNAADDEVIKSSPFVDNGVFIGTSPSNMNASPTELSPVPAAAYSISNHPLSNLDQVIGLAFRSNGTVVNAGGSAVVPANAVPTGATVYVWAKHESDTSANPTIGNLFRALTILGSSGSTKLWKCNVTNNQCANWIR